MSHVIQGSFRRVSLYTNAEWTLVHPATGNRTLCCEVKIGRFFLKNMSTEEISINLKHFLSRNYLFLWSGLNSPLQSLANQFFSQTFEQFFSKKKCE